MEICPKAETAGKIEKPAAGQIITGLAGILGKNLCPSDRTPLVDVKSMT